MGVPTSTVSYSYDNSRWGDQLTKYDGESISYDVMGNPTSYLGKALTWEGKQLITCSQQFLNNTVTTAFAYNEDGLRISKTSSMAGSVSQTTNYYYNGSVLMAMTSGNISQRFSYDSKGRVVSVNYNGTEYYYLRNAQGDIVKLIDGSGTTVVEYAYDSWGKKISTTGTLATSLGTNQPFRYRGYVYDEETQWYYLQSRYYDPTTCRFISADVYLSTGQGVLGHNAFAYCGNNPVARTDASGFEWYDDVWNWITDEASKVSKWVSDQIGFTYIVEIDNEWNGDSSLGISEGFIDSQMSNSGMNKPISFFIKQSSSGSSILDYQIGISFTFEGFSISPSLGIGSATLELEYNKTSVELSANLEEISVTTSAVEDFGVFSHKTYSRYYVKQKPLLTAVVMVATAVYISPFLSWPLFMYPLEMAY